MTLNVPGMHTCIASSYIIIMIVIALIPHHFDKHYPSIQLYMNMYCVEYKNLH